MTEPGKIDNPLKIISVLVVCFVGGWSLSQLSPGLFAQSLVEPVLNAHRTMYYSKLGAPNEALQYYVYGSDFSELSARVSIDPGIIEYKPTRLPRLSTVKLDNSDASVRQRVKSLNGIDSVIRIPDFCH